MRDVTPLARFTQAVGLAGAFFFGSILAYLRSGMGLRDGPRRFDAYGQEILGGMDAIDVAAPYIQSMSEILELNPADVNLFDPTIRKALSYRDPKTKEPAPLSVAEFEDRLRADKRWQYTDNAHEQLTQYAVELGKLFGVLS